MKKMSFFTAVVLVASGMLLLCVPAPARENASERQEGASEVEGNTAQSKSHFELTLPRLVIEGGGVKWRGKSMAMPRLLDVPEESEIPWSWGGGGRISALMLPLSERLGPMTSERGIDSFNDVTYLIGGHLYLNYKKTLQIGVYFDTGFQKVDDTVGGHRREAEFNLFRIGTDLEVKKPLPWITDRSELLPSTLGTGLPRFAKNIMVGFGIESGAGGMSLEMEGDDLLYEKKNAYIPLFYLTPKMVCSLRIMEYSLVEFYAGYYISSFNDLTTDFTIEDDRMMDGSNFNAFVMGVHINFGTGEAFPLWK